MIPLNSALGDIAHDIQLALAVACALHLARLIAVLFVLAMLALIGSLGLFLREIYLGVNTTACPVR